MSIENGAQYWELSIENTEMKNISLGVTYDSESVVHSFRSNTIILFRYESMAVYRSTKWKK